MSKNCKMVLDCKPLCENADHRLVTETFTELDGINFVTIVGDNITGSAYIVERNGQTDNDYTLSGKTFMFNTPFSVPSNSGSTGESIDITYLTKI